MGNKIRKRVWMWCGEIFGIVEIRFYVVSGTSTMFVLFCFAFVFVYIDHLALYTFPFKYITVFVLFFVRFCNIFFCTSLQTKS